MKRFVLIAVTLFMVNSAFGQNLQLHYDLGEDRDYLTTTFEMFKPDDWGATFWFIDMDYDREQEDSHRSMSLSYVEIARYINLPFSENLSFTLQYNDGMIFGFPLGPIWLVGGSYPIDLGFITLQTDLLYRWDYSSDAPDAQVTFVWFKPFMEGKITFMGFLDIWTHDKAMAEGKEFVLLTEPQIWYNVNQHLALGTEFEFSDNFLPSGEFKVMPTLGVKWTF